MKFQRSQLIILFIFFIIISCKNNKTNSLEEYIKGIDEIPISETIYIFEIDSNKNVTDTLALRKLKYDDNENLIYENNLQLKSNLETINYYDVKNGMIYSTVKQNGEIISDFKTTIEKGLIVSANYNVYGNGIKDSVFMKYHYTFDKEKKKKLLIDSGDDFHTIELYNELEKPILNFSMHEKDTWEKTEFMYNEYKMIKKKIVKNFSVNEEVIYEYDDGFIIRESLLINGVEEFYADYDKDEQGNHLRYTKMR